MRTGGNLPIVIADAVNSAGRFQIAERRDGVIAYTALEDIAEDHDWAPMTGKRHTEAATLAGVVVHKLRLRIHHAVPRCREEQTRAVIGFALLLRGRAVALVEPCREHRAIIVERERLEPLADIARRDGLDGSERLAAIGRARGEHLAIERLVAECRERDDQVTLFVDHDLGACIRAPVHIELLIGDGNRLAEISSAIC